MKKTLMIMVLAGMVSLLALTGCATVAGQTQGNNSTAVANPADPIQAPPLEERLVDFPEFLSVTGTISDVEEVDSNVSLVRIFWDEVIGSGDAVAVLPSHIYLYVNRDTVLLLDSELETGIFVTAVYRAPTREQQLSPGLTLPAVAISDKAIRVARYDEDWMYSNVRLTITDETEIILQDGQPFDGEIDELRGRALVTIIGMSATPVPGAENPIHENWPSKVVVLFERGNEQPVTIPPPPQLLHGLDIVSEWATAGIIRAYSLGLIQTSWFAYPNDYTLPITRAEFAALAAALYEVTTNMEIAGRMNFNDTDDINVQKMGYLGVVTGVGNGSFAPDDAITREQAAVMLSRLAETLKGQPLGFYLTIRFYDSGSISLWALEDVYKMVSHNIMTGVGEIGFYNRFAPQQPFTREQSIITILRLFDSVTANAAPVAADDVNIMDYAAFIDLLVANGFVVEEGQEFPGGTWNSPLSVMQRVIYVDGEWIRVEIYDSSEVMERASGLIGITSVRNPEYPHVPTAQITWAPEASPRWFKRDLIIVHYSGNESRIVDFLMENLTFFVGRDYPNRGGDVEYIRAG